MTNEQFKKAIKLAKKAGKQFKRGRRRRRRAQSEERFEEAFYGVPLMETRIEHSELRELIEELKSPIEMEEFIQRIENPELQAILANDEGLNEYLKRLSDSKRRDLVHRLQDILTIQNEKLRQYYRTAIILNFLYRQ